MISIEMAQRLSLGCCNPLQPESVPLFSSVGRIIAEDVTAPWDVPMSDNSAMDGFALCSSSSPSGQWQVVDFLPAGSCMTAPVPSGAAIRIMTGAPLPPACDTVIPLEDVEQIESVIRPLKPLKTGAHVRKRGEDLTAGQKVLQKGALLRAQDIGLLASLGRSTVKTYRKVRVAILSTGDELLEAGEDLTPGKIINSNSQALAALVIEAGGEPVMIGIAADSAAATVAKIKEGLQADILITTGGVSVGDRDFVKESIQLLGGKVLFWKVNMKPGKPVAFALLEEKPVFALPGNPVAAMVSFEMLVRPAMLKMMGHQRIFRPVVMATLGEEMKNPGDRPHLVRVRVTMKNGIYRATSSGNQSSASLASLAKSNGLLLLEANTSIASGSSAEVTLLDRGFEMGMMETLAA